MSHTISSAGTECCIMVIKTLHLHLSHTVGINANAMLMQCASFSNHTAASSTAATLMFHISIKIKKHTHNCACKILQRFPRRLWLHEDVTAFFFLVVAWTYFWNSLVLYCTHYYLLSIVLVEKYCLLLFRTEAIW